MTKQQAWINMFDDRERYALVVIYFLMTIIGGIGNIVSIKCVCKQMEFQTDIKNSHKILMSLIISDTIIVLLLCPIQAFQFLNVMPNPVYEVSAFVFMMACCASSFSIVLLAVERYLKLTKFKTYHLLLFNRRINGVVAICWVVSILMSTTKFLRTSVDNILYCITVLGTLVSLFVFYILIYRFTRKSQKKIKKMKTELKIQPNGPTKDISRPPLLKKLTRKVLLLIASYLLCTFAVLPVGIIYWLELVRSTWLFNMSVVLCLANSCINPVIYVISDVTFRKRAKMLFYRTQLVISAQKSSTSLSIGRRNDNV